MLAQQIVFPLFGIATTVSEDAGIAALFTLVSLVRSYAIRRLFERWRQAASPNVIRG